MIAAELIEEYVSDFPMENVPCEGGGIRKYVLYFSEKIYLYPSDPRFGAKIDGTLYTFRRAGGPSRGLHVKRKAFVDYSRPRMMKGHSDKKGNVRISITTHDKRNKAIFVAEIFRDKPTYPVEIGFHNSEKSDLSAANIYWKSKPSKLKQWRPGS